MDFKRTKKLIAKHEGKRHFVYLCPAGKQTIGIGRNLNDKGLSDEEIDFLLENDIKECLDDLKGLFSSWMSLDNVRQAVLVDMRFNLGAGGFRKFKKLIKAVREKSFSAARLEMLDSKWARMVRKRAQTLAAMMETGEWI